MRVLIDGVRHHKCDWCRRDFTVEGADHLTFQLGERSGVATLNTRFPGWRFASMLRPQSLHFCLPIDGKQSCLDQWQRALGDEPLPEYVIS